MNTIDPHDPRLMDLVLGELDSEEAEELKRQLDLPENESAQKEVHALQKMAELSRQALGHEKDRETTGLTPAQRDRVMNAAETVQPFQRRAQYRLYAMAAMALLCVGAVLVIVPAFQPAREAAVRTELAEEKDLRLQVERIEVSGLDKGAADASAVGIQEERPEVLHLEKTSGDLSVAPAGEPAAASTTDSDASGDIYVHVGNEISATAGRKAEPTDMISAKPSESPLPASPVAEHAIPAETTVANIPESAPKLTVAVEPVSDVHIRGAETRPEESYTSRATEIPPLTSSVPSSPEKMRDGTELRETDRLGIMQPMVTPPMPPSQWPYPGGEAYARIEERAFSSATEEPLSTFSLHPDSASYTNVRRFLEQGQWPPHDAVRLEELINYFSYDYPQPVGKHPFSVNVELGPCPWAAGHLLAKVGLQGRTVERADRPPANLVFLIDTSGSMRGPNRLPLVKESLKAMLETLEPPDRVAIVTYAGESRVALESTPVSQRNVIRGVIDSLSAGGSTHGSAGIQDAYAIARSHFITEGINRVLLATDGDFNLGVTHREGLLSLIETQRQTGVFLTVLGYGMGNLKDGTLEMLASKGNGNYAYIDDYAEARRILVEQVGGALMTIAKDAKIQVEFNPALVRSYRLLGYENRMMAARDFNDDAKDAGEIGAGHTVTALYQIVPQGVAPDPGVDSLRYREEETDVKPVPANTGELMFVKLRYKQPDGDTSNLIEIPVPALPLTMEQSSADFRFAAAAAGLGLLLRESSYKGEATFESIRELAASAVADNPQREELLNLIVTAKILRGQ